MNKLIVESKNDKTFVEAVIRAINESLGTLVSAEVDVPICNIDSFECLEGLDTVKLKTKIEDILTDVRVEGRSIKKLGILIDLDNKSIVERIEFINEAIEKAFFESFNLVVKDLFKLPNELKSVKIDEFVSLEIACCFTNYGGKGELETLLKGIKTQTSPYADCLEEWKKCISSLGESISQKEFDKFWLSNYVRFDTCTKTERKQAERKCSVRNLDYVLKEKSHIFDFNSTALDEIRDFLKLFPA